MCTTVYHKPSRIAVIILDLCVIHIPCVTNVWNEENIALSLNWSEESQRGRFYVTEKIYFLTDFIFRSLSVRAKWSHADFDRTSNCHFSNMPLFNITTKFSNREFYYGKKFWLKKKQTNNWNDWLGNTWR